MDVSRRQRAGIMITLMIGTIMAILDANIVNVALPSIMKSFQCSFEDVAWVVSAYMMGFVVIMPAAQWLKDRFGYFRAYSVSLTVFTLGSWLCGMVPSLEWLVVARVMQAMGGGFLTPTALALISAVFPPAERGRAIGIWGLGVIAGPALGPTLGGFLTEYFGWPSIFLINLPLGVVALGLSVYFLRPISVAVKNDGPFDWIGFVFFNGAVISLLYGVSQLEQLSVKPWNALSFIGVSIACFYIFLRYEWRCQHPLFDLGIFTNRSYVACLFVTFTRSVALYGGVFLLPFLLQDHLQYSEMQTGMLMLPATITLALMLPVSGRFADHFGVKKISAVGVLLLTISMFLFGFFTPFAGAMGVVVPMIVRGMGLGLLLTPISVATMNSVPERHSTLAASVSSLTQQIGGAIGIASLTVIHEVIKNYSPRLHDLTPDVIALTSCFAIAGVLVAMALIPLRLVPNKAEGFSTEAIVMND